MATIVYGITVQTRRGIVRGTAGMVQHAVDNDSEVILRGAFDFGSSSVKITTTVSIWSDTGATIYNGTFPFDVQAPGQSVKIQGLHFDGPTGTAIQAQKVGGLEISDCVIGGLKSVQVQLGGDVFNTAGGIQVSEVDSSGNFVGAISGRLTFSNNEISISTVAGDRTFGIGVVQVGSPSKVDVLIMKNKVEGVTAFGLRLVNITGKASVEGNDIFMDPVGVNKQGFKVSGVLCSGPGLYSVTGNESIRCEFGKAAGIRLFNNTSPGCLVDGNGIFMHLPDDTLDTLNAGIEIRGNSNQHTVSNNMIAGTARAAFSVIKDSVAPRGNSLTGNFQTDFKALVADICIDHDVDSTTIVAPDEFRPQMGTGRAGTIEDLGTNLKYDGDYNFVP